VGAAEDACQEFALQRFRTVIRRYDPARGTFEGFLMVCFRRYCRAKARRMGRHLKRHIELDEQLLTNLVSREPSPEARLIMKSLKQRHARNSRRLQEEVATALARLRPADRALLVLQYWDGARMADIASKIRRKEGATRTRSCRARDRIAPFLRATATEFRFGGKR
jgi:RNA polymerase sigma factor (sigma-70 family)